MSLHVRSVLLGICLFAALQSGLFARSWTSSAGGKLEGEFVSTDGASVTIKRAEDGVEITIPLLKLSQADRDFVAAQEVTKSAPAKPLEEGRYADKMTGQWEPGITGDKLPYLIFGKDIDAAKKYPVVIYLHGPGGAGSDNKSQLNDGAAETFVKPENYLRNPCIVVAPQIATGKFWTGRSGTAAANIAKDLVANMPVDPKRIYICGHSIGGVGALYLFGGRGGGTSYRHVFAAAVVAGAAVAIDNGYGFREVPILAFHGSADELIPVESARAMVEAANGRGGMIKLTEFPGEGQDIVPKVFGNPAVHEWLFLQVMRDRR